LSFNESISNTSNVAGTTDLKICNRILKQLMLNENSKPFKIIKNPNIANPMDLTTIEKNLTENAYKSAPEFAADFRLILTNCFQYYPVDHEMINMSREINKLFDEEYYKHVSLGYAREAEASGDMNGVKNSSADEGGNVQNGGHSDSATHSSAQEGAKKAVQEQEKKTKEFNCEECGKKLGTSYNLKRHKLAHQKEKIFSCKLCNKSFSQKANMLRQTLHHKE
jgi:DNA-directed RNA polymerase subunit M/transcription elongation factor TFIIS